MAYFYKDTRYLFQFHPAMSAMLPSDFVFALVRKPFGFCHFFTDHVLFSISSGGIWLGFVLPSIPALIIFPMQAKRLDTEAAAVEFGFQQLI